MTLGQPVELGQIARELKKLWESAAGTKSRASLVNFVIYCKGEEALESNTQLISEFTQQHSCRAILLATIPETTGKPVQAWINAHCHLSRAGAKQVCCEQITFVFDGTSQKLLANVLFANLDSDLPLYLWWQTDLPEHPNEQLWTWVDRLIFDSREWQDLKTQFSLLGELLQQSHSRLIPCDLNWTRTLHLRQAVAQMFDLPENLAQIPTLDRLTLTHGPGFQSTALLFVGWIVGQLRWTFENRQQGVITLRTASGNRAELELREGPGASISRCELVGPEASVCISRERDSHFLHAQVRASDGSTHNHLLPAGCDSAVDLLDEELTTGGRHKVYLKALSATRPLL